MSKLGIMSINTMVSSQATHVPAFLAKLWRLVDDPTTNSLICWSEGGNSFIIHHQARFAQDLLPLYYKHNNMASFVRQLNMYGFHKVVSVEQGGLRVEKDEMEFAHPHFLQGNEGSLDMIKRKIPASKSEEIKRGPENMSNILIDVRQIKGKQESMDGKLEHIKRENELLWRELTTLRAKHAKQQQIVSKLLQFLVSMMSTQAHRLSFKRRMPLMLSDIDGDEKPAKLSRPSNVANTDESSNGPVIHEVFEGEEPLLILSLQDDARNEQQPQQASRASITKEAQRKLVAKAQNAGVKMTPKKGTTSSAASNEFVSNSTAVNQQSNNSAPLDQLTENSGTLELFQTMESPFTVESAGSPYVTDLPSINSTESVVSPQPSPAGSSIDHSRDPVISTDMIPMVDDVPLSRRQVATKSVVKTEPTTGRDDLDFHLDDVQFGLDSLKDLLQGTQYNLDSNTLSGVGSPFNFNNLDSHAVAKLFGPDSHNHLFGIVNENNEMPEGEGNLQGNELNGSGSEMVSYNPCLFELAEDDSHFFEESTGNNGAFLDDELESMLTTDRNALSLKNGGGGGA